MITIIYFRSNQRSMYQQCNLALAKNHMDGLTWEQRSQIIKESKVKGVNFVVKKYSLRSPGVIRHWKKILKLVGGSKAFQNSEPEINKNILNIDENEIFTPEEEKLIILEATRKLPGGERETLENSTKNDDCSNLFTSAKYLNQEEIQEDMLPKGVSDDHKDHSPQSSVQNNILDVKNRPSCLKEDITDEELRRTLEKESEMNIYGYMRDVKFSPIDRLNIVKDMLKKKDNNYAKNLGIDEISLKLWESHYKVFGKEANIFQERIVRNKNKFTIREILGIVKYSIFKHSMSLIKLSNEQLQKWKSKYFKLDSESNSWLPPSESDISELEKKELVCSEENTWDGLILKPKSRHYAPEAKLAVSKIAELSGLRTTSVRFKLTYGVVSHWYREFQVLGQVAFPLCTKRQRSSKGGIHEEELHRINIINRINRENNSEGKMNIGNREYVNKNSDSRNSFSRHSEISPSLRLFAAREALNIGIREASLGMNIPIQYVERWVNAYRLLGKGAYVFKCWEGTKEAYSSLLTKYLAIETLSEPVLNVCIRNGVTRLKMDKWRNKYLSADPDGVYTMRD